MRNMAIGIGTLLLAFATPGAAAETWKAGAAKVSITPEQYMWMAGYAARTKPAEGKMTDLWAKALVLEDPAGKRAVLVTLDLVGVERGLSAPLADKLGKRYNLDRSQIAINCSHTHSGPVVARNLRPMHEYSLPKPQQELIHQYADRLEPVWNCGHEASLASRQRPPDADQGQPGFIYLFALDTQIVKPGDNRSS